MANALKPLAISPRNNPDSVLVGVTPSGNYVAGGDTTNLAPSTWTDPAGVGIIGPSQLSTLPPEINVANAGGYYAQWIPGTDLTNGKLMWFAPGGAQVAAGAYPAAITGATIVLRVFLRD